MQAPTHLLTGKLIEKTINKRGSSPWHKVLTALLALLSHGVVDSLARITYHPAAPLPGDWFWITYHAAVALFTIYLVIRNWKFSKLGPICSILPDLDWLVLYTTSALGVQLSFWKTPILHEFVINAVISLPLLKYLQNLPDWTEYRFGVLFELVLLLILLALDLLLKGKEKPIPGSVAVA